MDNNISDFQFIDYIYEYLKKIDFNTTNFIPYNINLNIDEYEKKFIKNKKKQVRKKFKSI